MQNLIGALLPTLALIIYVILDHLWAEDPNEKLWRRLLNSLAYWNWDWRGQTPDTRKRQLAAGLVALLLLTGIAQFTKANRDTDETATTKLQLTNVTSLAASSLAAASNSDNDIRILEAFLDDSTHWQQKIYLRIGTNCPTPFALLDALDQEPPPTLVASNGSPSLRSWAATWAEAVQHERDQTAIKQQREQLGIDEQSRQQFQETLPLWEYVLAAFKSKLKLVSDDTGKTLTPNIQSMPDPFPSGVFDWGTIAVGTNAAWNFRVYIERAPVLTWSDPPLIRIASKDREGTPRIYVRRTQTEVAIEFFDNAGKHLTNAPLSDLTNVVNQSLEKLIGTVQLDSPIEK
ncbi:MAG: hypothetical protein ACLP0A_09670 [Verrucomicrobiia bacterium]